MGLNVYLSFNGNCEEAMNFYKNIINAQIESIQYYDGISCVKFSESYKSKIAHGVMFINGTKLMCADVCEDKNLNVGNNFSLALDFKNVEDMQRMFDALSTNEGKITMPIQDTFWNAKFGMCTDKFGINWMFNYCKSQA
ncbi:unnamed protein product [Didymodactylos carnosus]|uniref:PhnB-like domain-containing protein n=1 Tax=Didymodactylos carnosus TaxID=1234261 RepID=A0A816D259_9BILA|nr:unnamed protein product [Didymodactylos carnosus]CAF4533395.1 unnamed protein product [Didymodactylos carnosus]